MENDSRQLQALIQQVDEWTSERASVGDSADDRGLRKVGERHHILVGQR
jgi:hypothetical protein